MASEEESSHISKSPDNNSGLHSSSDYDQTATTLVEIEKQLKNHLNLNQGDDDKEPRDKHADGDDDVAEVEVEHENVSIGWHQDGEEDYDEYNSERESNGGRYGEENNHNYNDNDNDYDNYDFDGQKVGDDNERFNGANGGINRRFNANYSSSNQYQYPVRPEAEDCSYYLKTGTCKFGSNCKFNHPVNRRKPLVSKDKVKEREELTDRPGQTECKYYLRTGGCKYGKACRYNHSRAKLPVLPAKTTVSPALDLNFLGLPIRPGERECPYYMRNGTCKYASNCRFNHPDPTTVGGSGASDPPAFSNGGSAPLQNSSQSSVPSWSSPRGLNEPAAFMPLMYSNRGVPSQSPEWNGYQAPVYPPERGIHQTPAYGRGNRATETNVYAHQLQIPGDGFPERPGQPECSYYMKTGDCKFKSNCKYHHPKNHTSKSPPCVLSDKGLPLRPGQSICSYYSRYGICKFGPACKFDHPIQATPSTGSADDLGSPYSNSVVKEEAKMTESGIGSDALIQQSV